MNTATHGADTPPPLPPVKLRTAPSGRAASDTTLDACRSFLRFTGGSIFYCLSAMSIIYGITQILGPTLLKAGKLSDTLPCIGALNFYELALLATLVFVVVRHRVTDDAISLVVLVPLFLVGSGIALDTVANNGPLLALVIGVLCAAVGVGKLFVLRHVILLPMNRLILIGMALLLVWNYLTGPGLVALLANHPLGIEAKRTLWLSGLLLVVASGFATWISAGGRAASSTPRARQPEPFLRTMSMVCVLVLVLIGAAGAHVYSLAYMFDIRSSDGDYLLLLLAGTLLLVDVLIRWGGEAEGSAVVMSCVPLLVTIGVVADHRVCVAFGWNLDVLVHPCSVLILGSCAMVQLARQTRRPAYLWIAAAYALVAVLTWGWSPMGSPELNWRLTAGLVVAATLAAGFLLRLPGLCIAAVILGTLGLPQFDSFGNAVRHIGLSIGGGLAGAGGLGLLLVTTYFADRKYLPAVYLGAALLAGCAFDYLAPAPGWRDLVTFIVLSAASAAVWWRLRCWPSILILAVPLAARLWLLFRTLSAWRYIILSFVLLALGAWMSAAKGRKAKCGSPETPSADQREPSQDSETTSTTPEP